MKIKKNKPLVLVNKEDVLMTFTGQDLPADRNEYIKLVTDRIKNLDTIVISKEKGIPT